MKKGYYHFVGIYLSIYGALGMMLPLLGPYLKSIGMTGVQVGTITSSATIVSIIANPFWGARYHHSHNKKRMVLMLCIAAMLLGFTLSRIDQYWLFLAAYAVLFFFHTPVTPLFDALTLERQYPFGAIRKYGALGFASGVFIAGQVAERMGLPVIFSLFILGYLVGILLLILVIRQANQDKRQKAQLDHLEQLGQLDQLDQLEQPKWDEKSVRKKSEGNYLSLLKNKKVVALLISGFFMYGPSLAHNTYFGFLYQEVGGSVAGIGLAFLLMAGSEAPIMAYVHKFSEKFTLERILLISMILSSLRFFWYGTSPSPALLMGTFFLQGIINGIFLIEFVHYITKQVEPALIGMTMTLYQAISSNMSTILCQFAGGILLDYLGSAAVYTFFGAFNLIGILCYLGFGLHKRT